MSPLSYYLLALMSLFVHGSSFCRYDLSPSTTGLASTLSGGMLAWKAAIGPMGAPQAGMALGAFGATAALMFVSSWRIALVVLALVPLYLAAMGAAMSFMMVRCAARARASRPSAARGVACLVLRCAARSSIRVHGDCYPPPPSPAGRNLTSRYKLLYKLLNESSHLT